MKTTNKNRT